MSALNPVTVHKEFGGDLGALGITFGLPVLIVFFYLICNENYILTGIDLDFSLVKQEISGIDWINDICFNLKIWKYYCYWFFGLLLLDLIIPGTKIKGTKLRDGSQLTYKINGLNFIIVLSLILLSKLYLNNGYLVELEFLYDNFLGFLVTSIEFSLLLSNFLFVYSYLPLLTLNNFKTNERILSINGNSKSFFYNWFIGRELNPRIFKIIDLKFFCELKPGLLLWLIINLSCIHHQYWKLGKIYDSLWLVNFLQLFYIFDGVLNEMGVVSMIDITTDGFGFMLVFGDLSLVPFSYSLQARYLSIKPLNLGYLNCTLITLLMLVGYHIFSQSNKQKSDWKQGLLNDKDYKFIKTKTGTKLLCDGWWGISQHTNYFGDWIISWSWCLATGFQTPLTYYYVFYFAGLLIHRQQRDEMKCSTKYGEKWVEYKKKVPYKIIPYVY